MGNRAEEMEPKYNALLENKEFRPLNATRAIAVLCWGDAALNMVFSSSWLGIDSLESVVAQPACFILIGLFMRLSFHRNHDFNAFISTLIEAPVMPFFSLSAM